MPSIYVIIIPNFMLKCDGNNIKIKQTFVESIIYSCFSSFKGTMSPFAGPQNEKLNPNGIWKIILI